MTTWKHDELQLPTSFRVKIAGSEGQYETTTQDPQYDLSHFILESVDRLMGFHYVNVTAVQEGHESNSVISQTFTFDILKTADITCKLDFPPVNMTVKDLEATVKFSNPIQFYKVLKRYSDDFDFTILQGDMEFNERCRADQMTCGRDFLLPEKQEQHCVRLRGEMTISGAVGSVLFRETELICAHEQTGPGKSQL
ncbi:hypothetical protein LDENG_00237690 [Lucifuga dentata]|nr:hypothetical protein LDENG_00237690 [Lucifuga dentata]